MASIDIIKLIDWINRGWGRIIAWRRDGATNSTVLGAVTQPAIVAGVRGGTAPLARARPLPRVSSQLVIARHFLASRTLEPHRDLAVECVPVDVTFHRGGLRLAVPFDDHVVLRHSRLRQDFRYRFGTTP